MTVDQASCCSDQCLFSNAANYVASWQSKTISLASLATVNAIYWLVMPMTSTVTLVAVCSSIPLLVDAASYLKVLPSSVQYVESDKKNDDNCHAKSFYSSMYEIVDAFWKSQFLADIFPSTRLRIRAAIILASSFGLFLTAIVGVSLSTIIYLGASLFILSKPLRLSDPEQIPAIARLFKAIRQLKPKPTLLASSSKSNFCP